MSANQNVVIVQQSEPTQGFGFVALMIVCAITALIIHYIWYVLFGAFIFIGLSAAWWAASERHRLAATAELQNKQYLAGDPRGIFGEDPHSA